MKINRHGRAKILTQQEIQLIFSHGLHNNRDKTLFGVCYGFAITHHLDSGALGAFQVFFITNHI